MDNTYDISRSMPVDALPAEARARFIARTYGHLLGAILGFTAIEVFLFTNGFAASIAQALLGTSWLLVLGGFVLVSWVASRVAHTARSTGAQYGALAALVTAEAIIFVPLLYIADYFAPGAISSAGVVTLVGFLGLTVIAVRTGKDFSFLRGVLMWGGLCAMLLIVGAVAFSFSLGIVFSVGMIGFAGAAILYDTSNVLRHYPEDRYVAASLQLFASMALMFWYVLRLFLAFSRR